MNTDFQNQSVIDLLPNNGVVSPSVYAGFWRRLIAYAIDSLIIGVPLMVIGRMFGWVTLEQTANSAEAYTTSDGFTLFAGVVATLYFVLMESSDKQATFGKSVFGLRVTNMQGGRISLGQAFIRYFGKFLSVITLYIGFMMAGWTEKKQALHDKLAGTLVVRR